jgi:dCMP deaminase
VVPDARRAVWDRRFLALAALIATWSKDASTRVGCAVVDGHRVVRATGYNGLPRGVSDDVPARLERPEKYLWTEHAERNALYVSARHGVVLAGCSLYCTHPPCADCARGIVQAGLSEVVLPAGAALPAGRWADHERAAREMLAEACIVVRIVQEGPA